MFDKEVDVSLKKDVVGVKDKKSPFDWKSLPIDLLMKYRDEIEACMPPAELSKLNLEKEMLLQYHSLRALQNTVLADEGVGEEAIPSNQKAQVANSVTSSLHKLTELQTKLYTTERFKSIENALIRQLNKLPEDIAAAFIEDYEKILGDHG